MGNIIKLSVAGFAKKAISLDIGQHFDFALEAENEDSQREDDFYWWYGIQKIHLFDQEMLIIAEYGGSYCEAISTDNEHFMSDLTAVFEGNGWTSGVYAAESSKERKREVELSTGGLYLKGYTENADDIFIDSYQLHKVTENMEIRDTTNDIKSKIEEKENIPDFSSEDLRQMAKEAIHRRDNCDGISERYWSIIEEVIRDFSVKKEQKA